MSAEGNSNVRGTGEPGSVWDVNRRDILKLAGAGAAGAIGMGATTPTVAAESEPPGEFEIERVEPDDDDAFNYPYFVYGPWLGDARERPLLVTPSVPSEPGSVEQRTDEAEEWIENRGGHLARRLEVPVLVPVIPWYDEEEGEDSPNETHVAPALDAETMALDGTDLERFDEQLLAMIEDASNRLTEEWNPVAEGVLLDGVELGGLFVNRFAALHPEEVRSVSAGEFSGTALLPTEAIDETTLQYPIGVDDVGELIGKSFDKASFANVGQFLYQRSEPEFDLVEKDRLWSDDQKATVNDVYGDDPQARFDYSENRYADAELSAQFDTYDRPDHWRDTWWEAVDDIVAHHQPHVGVPFVDVERPESDADTVEVAGVVPYEGDTELELRAFRGRDGPDLTAEPVTVAPGEQVDTELELTESLAVGERVYVAALEPGVTDPAEAVSDGSAWVDETFLTFERQPIAGDHNVDVRYTVDDKTLYDTYEGEIKLNVTDGDGEDRIDEPLRIGPGGSFPIGLDEPLVEGEEITLIIQSYDEEDSPDEEIRSETATVAVGPDIQVAPRPEPGADSVHVTGEVPDHWDESLELRVFALRDDLFRDSTVDLTATDETVDPGEEIDTELELTETLETGHVVFVELYEPDPDDRGHVVASDVTAVDDTHLEFEFTPVAGDDEVVIRYTVASDDFDDHDELELLVVGSSGDDVTTETVTVGPGDIAWIELSEDLSEGDDLTAAIQPPGDYDPEEAIDSDTVTVIDDIELSATFSVSPDSPDTETEVTFDASASEPADEIDRYLWDFTTDQEVDAEGIQVHHTFSEPGEYEVSLAVIDGERGRDEIATETVTVREGCFIATAACGTPDHDHVESLRAFRDTRLKGNPVGELLVRLYYATSPPIADWIRKTERRRSLVRSTVVRPAARLTSALGLGDAEPES